MVSELSDRPPTVGETRERMQRVRVGVTGLAAVVLVVALATAVASSIRKSAADSVVPGRPDAVAAVNATDEKSEPLAQLGVAPNAKDVTVPPEKRAR